MVSLNVKKFIFKDCENRRFFFIYECFNDVSISDCKFENIVFGNESDGGVILIIDFNVEFRNL